MDFELADYSSVTEAPGVRVTPEAASMLYTRYDFAARFCPGKRVLEVGCGCGMGLGYLAQNARTLVGGDFMESLLRRADFHYQGRVPLVQLNAQTLPFKDESFDVVILFEAIYYLARPKDFLGECRRVLHSDGVLLICLPNKEWEGFNPSPQSTQYFSAGELQALFSSCRFDANLFGAFPSHPRTFWQRVSATVRKAAVRLHLIPKTMHGKEFLKRLFYGRLVELTQEIQKRGSEAESLIPLSPNGHMPKFKVLYALARPRCPGSPFPYSGSESICSSA